MKKLFTLVILLIVTRGFAQNALTYQDAKGYMDTKSTIRSFNQKKLGHSTSRANSNVIGLDYYASDDYSTTLTSGYAYHGFIWDVNTRFGNKDNFTLKYAAVNFDSLLYNLYDGSGTQVGTSFFPKAGSVITLDSFDILCKHEHVTAGSDTIHVVVYDRDSFKVTSQTPTGTINQNKVWDSTIVLTAALPTDANGLQILSFRPNKTFATGKTFGIRIDYTADTANHFNLYAGYKENCEDTAGGKPSVVPNNSFYYFNYTSGATNISGVNSVGLPGLPCPEFYIQDIVVLPYLTVTVPYGAGIIAQNNGIACPGSTLTLEAVAFGSDSLSNATVKWSVTPPTAGTISDTTSETPTFTVGTTNGTITLKVTDNTGAVATATQNIIVRGINVAFPSSPYTIACAPGSTVTMSSTLSGYTTGAKTYAWSTGAATASSSATAPGTYTLTVTNSAGCSAVGTATVSYPGGVTNTADFAVVYPNGKTYFCTGLNHTINNTSAKTAGWDASWDYDASALTSAATNGSFTFSAAKTAPLVLTMDSAGCTFKKTKNIQVKVCTGVEDVDFTQNIVIFPNPTTGAVNFEIPTFDKNLTINVYNILGAEVKSIKEETSGVFSKLYNFSDLSSGTYIVKITNGSKTATKRLTIDK